MHFIEGVLKMITGSQADVHHQTLLTYYPEFLRVLIIQA